MKQFLRHTSLSLYYFRNNESLLFSILFEYIYLWAEELSFKLNIKQCIVLDGSEGIREYNIIFNNFKSTLGKVDNYN